MTRREKTLKICYVALFTAVIIVLSQLPGIPLPGGVPMTLQTLIIPMAGVVLGTAMGTGSAVLYVLLGLVGLPVFSGFKGGLGVILGPTGGFILSFPLMAFFAGLGANAIKDPNAKKLLREGALYLGLLVGTVLNYLVGTLWFAGVYMGAVNRETLATGFSACVLPFIPTTILKIILAGILGNLLRKALVRAGLLT